MAEDIQLKNINDLEENSSTNNSDNLMVGNAGTNTLKRLKLSTLFDTIKSLMSSWTFSALNTTNKVITSAINELNSGKAPTSHASSGTTYGVGTTGNYGHCRTINNLTQSSHQDGYALSAYQGYLLNQNKAAPGDFSIDSFEESGISCDSGGYVTFDVPMTKSGYRLLAAWVRAVGYSRMIPVSLYVHSTDQYASVEIFVPSCEGSVTRSSVTVQGLFIKE